MNTLKPYDLVRIRDYNICNINVAHYGQTISHPTPDRTIMVRHVPDDPTTMEELPISTLERLNKSERKWVQYATVNGRGSFPVDMLRYDYCYPVTFTVEDSQRGPVAELNETPNEMFYQHDLLIVARATDTKAKDWTTARWNSFGWMILPIKTLKIEGK